MPKDARRADMLLLGCSDARHALYTLWTYGSECNRERGRWDSLGAEDRRHHQQQQQQQQQGSSAAALADGSLRTLRFTLNDREPACLARVLLLLQLFSNSYEELVRRGGREGGRERAERDRKEIGMCFLEERLLVINQSYVQCTGREAPHGKHAPRFLYFFLLACLLLVVLLRVR